MTNSNDFNIFNFGQTDVYGSFYNTGGGSVEPNTGGIFQLHDGAYLNNSSAVYMGVYGSESSGIFQIDYGAYAWNEGEIFVYGGGKMQLDGSMTVVGEGSLTCYDNVEITIGE